MCLTSFCVLLTEIQSPENRGQDFDVIEVDFSNVESHCKDLHPSNIYLFKGNNRNTRERVKYVQYLQ